MRTKTLLLAGAALALSLATSQAQVYSANIVGYVNYTYVGASGYTLVANPLDDGNGNQLTNLLANLPNKSQVLTWGGTVFNTAIKKTAGAWGGNVSLPPGVGFFVKNGGATDPAYTNTYVGSVEVTVGASGTNSLNAGYNLVGSVIPYAGDATVDTNLNLGANLANKSQLLYYNTGTQLFNTAVKKTGGSWNTSFPINVGDGFFVSSFTPTNWVETLNP